MVSELRHPVPQRQATATLHLSDRPDRLDVWWTGLWAHKRVLDVLARKDFQTRYKRASLGLAWAVGVPLLQSVILAFVFSRVIHVGNGRNFAIYVMSGVIAYSYFNMTLSSSTTAISDHASLTDKVWFPRVILPIVPCISNLVGLAISVVVLLASALVLGTGLGVRTFLLIPAALLLFTLTMALGLVLSTLNVYFRDIKFLVQAALMVWIYITPILYPAHLLRRFGPWLDWNPLTGTVAVFHMSMSTSQGPWLRAVVVAIIAALLLLTIGLEIQRRHDRLFVDKL